MLKPILKLIAKGKETHTITVTKYTVVAIDQETEVETELGKLECPDQEAADRAYAMARAAGIEAGGHTFDINALMM